jgi:hypothetical protein
MENSWSGVRPVRFHEEIFGLLDFAGSRIEGVTMEELRIKAISIRMEREKRRQKAVQKAITMKNRKRKKDLLLTKVEQIVRVLKKTGVIYEKGKLLAVTDEGRKLLNLRIVDEIGAGSLFIEKLVNSDYKAYWLFLRKLLVCDVLEIPKVNSFRNNEFRKFINSKGFFLDVWSFFIIRDLLYDFSLANYIDDNNNQLIFPLYEIQEEPAEISIKYKYSIKGPDANLVFWPNVNEKIFVEQLAKLYLSFCDNKYNRMMDLIKLREAYSYQYKTPERQFDLLLERAIKEETYYKIILSVGRIDLSSRTTSISKALSLPYNKQGLPYSYVRIGLGD